MKPLRLRLEEARRQLQMPWEVLERDYLLSWILAALGRVTALEDTLVFKGGTALKKCYFGDYRFSEDLDFSGVGNLPRGDALEKAINEACKIAVNLLDDYTPIEITCERYIEKEPHPGGQEAFTIRARFPWQKQALTRAIVEISVDEIVLRAPERRPILHAYGEPLEAKILVYSLEELIAEKLRAILQHIERLESRGWSRSRARDYYDLWRVLGTYRDDLDLSEFRAFLRQKCEVRRVSFQSAADFFPPTMMAYVEKTWEQWLGPLVPGLASFEDVVEELRPQIATLLH